MATKFNSVLRLGSGILALLFCVSCVSLPRNPPESAPAEPTTPRDGLKSVDVCSILTPEDLQELGLEGPGERVDEVESESGCDYMGEPFDAAIYKNQEQTVESYSESNNWATFERVSVNDRNGAQAVAKGSVGAGLYDTLFDAGGGVIIVTVQEVQRDAADEKAESLKLAERIASRVPR